MNKTEKISLKLKLPREKKEQGQFTIIERFHVDYFFKNICKKLYPDSKYVKNHIQNPDSKHVSALITPTERQSSYCFTKFVSKG